MTDDEVYAVTRHWWRTKLEKAEQVERVLAVAHGRVVAAFEPYAWDRWPAGEPYRYGFEGKVAPDAADWLGYDVRHLFKPGAANPVRYATVDEVRTPATASPPSLHTSGETILVLRISQAWHPAITPEELYDATRHWWVLNRERLPGISLVLAVAGGEVREAYRPTAWESCHEPGWEHRVGFSGEIDAQRQRWAGLDVSHLFKPGSANPVRYLSYRDFTGLEADAQAPSRVRELIDSADGEEPSLLEQVAPLFDALSGDLLWSMSQAAQELFHSNTLGWLIEHRPRAMQPLVELLCGRRLAPVDHSTVWREHANLDLVIESALNTGESVRIVVENKTYSIPASAQLENYYESKKLPWQKQPQPQDAEWTLLTLMAPTFPMPYTWQVVRYADLVRALDSVDAATLDDDGGWSGTSAPARELFERYRRLVRRLVDLEVLLQPAAALDSAFEVTDVMQHLVGTKFGGPLQRMRFSGLADLVQQRLNHTETIGTGFSKGTGLVEWTTALTDQTRIGWQLQGGQLRQQLVVGKRHPTYGRGDKAATTRAELADELCPDYFDLSAAERVLGPRLLPVVGSAGGWKHFAPDFVYRYRKVDPSTTTDQLADALVTLTRWGREFARRCQSL
ncbi:hypothetical protein [Nocardioides coralli]|uniref:hypothetical protein n=1 Tax=Nocardioides coralli TaxID=2872154 RepID=UPI001CA3D36E|nr:hypothetical protein [Nocardioides coralli]QZY29691.1 hypothetical protein K6T13_03080 [Nocardioides coralli]